MKCIKQFRYYGDKNPNNYPSNVNYDLLAHKNVFLGYGSITQMGIQAPAGTVFFLNNEQRYPIVIGETGIYEIDLQDFGVITAIRFEGSSLTRFDEQGSTDRILIDIIYEGAGADI
jgi:hypothetical protein